MFLGELGSECTYYHRSMARNGKQRPCISALRIVYREPGSLLVVARVPLDFRPVKKGCIIFFTHAEQTKPLKTVQKRTVIVTLRESAEMRIKGHDPMKCDIPMGSMNKKFHQ